MDKIKLNCWPLIQALTHYFHLQLAPGDIDFNLNLFDFKDQNLHCYTLLYNLLLCFSIVFDFMTEIDFEFGGNILRKLLCICFY